MKIRVLIDLRFSGVADLALVEKVCEFARFPMKGELVSAGRTEMGQIDHISHDVGEGRDWVATVYVFPPENWWGSGAALTTVESVGFVRVLAQHEVG